MKFPAWLAKSASIYFVLSNLIFPRSPFCDCRAESLFHVLGSTAHFLSSPQAITSVLPYKICFLLVGSVFNSSLQSSFIAWSTYSLSESPFVILSLYFRFLLLFLFFFSFKESCSIGLLMVLFLYLLFVQTLLFFYAHHSRMSWNWSVNNPTFTVGVHSIIYTTWIEF